MFPTWRAEKRPVKGDAVAGVVDPGFGGKASPLWCGVGDPAYSVVLYARFCLALFADVLA